MFTKDIKHPDEFDIVSGKTQLCNEFESINQSIRLILTTSKNELFGDPNYGCHLQEYLLKFHGQVLNDMVMDDIAESVNTQDTRVRIRREDITINDDPNGRTLNIYIRYHLSSSNMEGELYFTLVPKEEINE